MLATNSVEKKRQELLSKLFTLSRTLSPRQRRTAIELVRILSSYACDEKVKYLIENPSDRADQAVFDGYYREKSRYATIFIIDQIKSALSANGMRADIKTEQWSDIGRYDIVIARCHEDENRAINEELRVEVKASLGIDLEQIVRYLWHQSPLILVRVLTRHVAELEPSKLQQFAICSIRKITAAADRIFAGQVYTVPGLDCLKCPNGRCPYYVAASRKASSLVALSDDDFGRDLEVFLQNLNFVSEKTVSLIMEKFGKGSSGTQVALKTIVKSLDSYYR